MPATWGRYDERWKAQRGRERLEGRPTSAWRWRIWYEPSPAWPAYPWRLVVVNALVEPEADAPDGSEWSWGDEAA